MGIKNQNFIRYKRQGGSVKIEYYDETERKIDKFFCTDNKSYANAIQVLKEKYGWKPEVNLESSPNFDKETDWLNPNFDL